MDAVYGLLILLYNYPPQPSLVHIDYFKKNKKIKKALREMSLVCLLLMAHQTHSLIGGYHRNDNNVLGGKLTDLAIRGHAHQ